MQDSKDKTSPSDGSAAPDATPHDRDKSSENKKNADSDGWQQYRQWISKAPAPRTRRTSVDPSLYTWKGYRNWSEQVKRNWSDS